MDDLENPSVIDEGLSRTRPGKAPAPLILIHDGGGTTFSYHCLEPIGRPTYGIYNAHFEQGGFWEGGVPAIAAHYIGLLAKILPEGGDILLGGWSFGGMLCLEMAHQLATSAQSGDNDGKPKFRVLGLIMVDTVFPRNMLGVVPRSGPTPPPPPPADDIPVVKSPEELKAMPLKEKVALNMRHATIMARVWDMPRWGDAAGGARVPPTILLRATKRLDEPDPVDYSRDNYRMLGWEKYAEEVGPFIESVVDLEGSHFSLFEFSRIEVMTEKIREAADKLDKTAF